SAREMNPPRADGDRLIRGPRCAAGERVDDERRSIRIRGVVQGVGFRPAMFRLAESLGLAGFVRNDREGVWVEVEGPVLILDRFALELPRAAPPASRIDTVEQAVIPLRQDRGFGIAESPREAGSTRASAEIPC